MDRRRPHTRTHACLALLVCGLAAAMPVAANRPLNTDTADTITNERCQFEPYAGRTRADDAPDARFWLLQLNCGTSERQQLGASVARAWAGEDSAHVVAVGGKTNLVAIEAGRTGLGVGYTLSAQRPRGASWTGEGAQVYGIASRELLEGWLVHANLGWSHSRSAHQHSTTWAVATELSVGPTVLSAEAYGDDRQRPWRAAGILWQATERFSVNASYGVQRGNARARQVTAGMLVEF